MIAQLYIVMFTRRCEYDWSAIDNTRIKINIYQHL